MKFEFSYGADSAVERVVREFEASSWFLAAQDAQRFFRCERAHLTWKEISPHLPSAGAGVIDNRKAPGA